MIKLKNISIGKQITAGFVIIISAMVMLTGIAIISVEKTEEINLRVIHLRLPTVVASTEMRNGINHSLAALRGWMILGKNQFKQERQTAWHEIEAAEKTLNEYAANWTNPENIRRLKNIESSLLIFKAAQQQIENISGTSRHQEAIQLLGTKAAPEAAKILHNLELMINNQKELAETDIVAADTSAEQLINSMFIILSIATIAGILIALFTVKSITSPLKIMLASADDLRQGDGDLTKRLPDFGNNEIGQTANSFNHFLDRIQSVLLEVRKAVENMSDASKQVSETAQTLSQGSSEQAASVEETSASLEQMNATINQNTENSKATDAIANRTASKAQEGGEAVASTVSAMTEITGKISLIEDIAYKTNLLALNAAIEAARAGEHGKGFAVVADEVRKLAERSQTSSQEISELAKNSVTIAQKAGTLLNDIVPAIQQTAGLVSEISASSEEQSQGIGQVTTAIDQLEKVSQHNASASEQLAATAEEMTAQVNQLDQTISFFKLEKRTTSGSKAVESGSGQYAAKHTATSPAHTSRTTTRVVPNQPEKTAKPEHNKSTTQGNSKTTTGPGSLLKASLKSDELHKAALSTNADYKPDIEIGDTTIAEDIDKNLKQEPLIESRTHRKSNAMPTSGNTLLDLDPDFDENDFKPFT